MCTLNIFCSKIAGIGIRPACDTECRRSGERKLMDGLIYTYNIWLAAEKKNISPKSNATNDCQVLFTKCYIPQCAGKIQNCILKACQKKTFGTFMFSWQYHWCHFLLALNPVSVESLCVSLCHYVTFVRIKTNNWEVSEFKRKFSLKLRGLDIEFMVCEVRWYLSPVAVEWLPTVQLGLVAIWLYWSVKLNPRVLSWA